MSEPIKRYTTRKVATGMYTEFEEDEELVRAVDHEQHKAKAVREVTLERHEAVAIMAREKVDLQHKLDMATKALRFYTTEWQDDPDGFWIADGDSDGRMGTTARDALAQIDTPQEESLRPMKEAPKDRWIIAHRIEHDPKDVAVIWDTAYSIHGLGGHWTTEQGGQYGHLHFSGWREQEEPPKPDAVEGADYKFLQDQDAIGNLIDWQVEVVKALIELREDIKEQGEVLHSLSSAQARIEKRLDAADIP